MCLRGFFPLGYALTGSLDLDAKGLAKHRSLLVLNTDVSTKHRSLR